MGTTAWVMIPGLAELHLMLGEPETSRCVCKGWGNGEPGRGFILAACRLTGPFCLASTLDFVFLNFKKIIYFWLP